MVALYCFYCFASAGRNKYRWKRFNLFYLYHKSFILSQLLVWLPESSTTPFFIEWIKLRWNSTHRICLYLHLNMLRCICPCVEWNFLTKRINIWSIAKSQTHIHMYKKKHFLYTTETDFDDPPKNIESAFSTNSLCVQSEIQPKLTFCINNVVLSFHSHFLVAGVLLLLLLLLPSIPICPINLPVDGSRQHAYTITTWIDTIEQKIHFVWDLSR